MKNYILTIQEEDNFCVCSCLQAIFRKYGIRISQKKIAAELTKKEKGFDTENNCKLPHLFCRHLRTDVKLFSVPQSPNKTQGLYDIEDYRIRKFLEQGGFSYEFFLYNQTPFNEPDSLLERNREKDIIIGVNSHSFLLEDFHYPKLFLLDPKDAFVKDKKLDEVMREMHESNSGGFGLIEKLNS